jgi:hypothetical protein
MSEQPVPYLAGPDAPSPLVVTNALAIARYLLGDITEGRLCRQLGLDRLEARERVAEFLNLAIANASVPIERTGQLEERLARANADVERLELEVEDLRHDLRAERGHVVELLRVAEYARRLTNDLNLEIGEAGEADYLSAARLHQMASEAMAVA